MRRWKKILYGVGFFFLAGLLSCIGLWFAFLRPIVPQGEVGELQFETLPFQRNGSNDGEYEIGVFFVPENRSNPDSRVIPIDYVRFRAKEQKGPPVFLLPGGPANTYIGSTPQTGKIPQFEKLRAFSDVVFVNQRGYNPRRRDILVAYRNKPNLKPDSTLDDSVASYKEFARKATADYKDSDVDLSGYTISECAADVNDLRKALGYEKIMLMGQSFGSQWSFAVMRNHPEIVERAILTGVEPLDHGYDMPSHVMNAARRIWKHLDSDPDWAPFIPPEGMEKAAEKVLARLENSGVEIKGSKSGETKIILGPDDFPWNNPAAILELYHGQTDRWSKGRGAPYGFLQLIFPLIDSSTGVTEERRARIVSDPAFRFVSRNNYAAAFMATADIWPSPDAGDDFRLPVECDIPVVFIHGDWDRSTPIENTLEIAPFFPNSHTLLIERGGHNPFFQLDEHPDVYAALMRFAETGSVEGIPDRITVKPNLGRDSELPRIDPATIGDAQ